MKILRLLLALALPPVCLAVAPAARAAEPAPLRVATYNVHVSVDDLSVERDVLALLDASDVVALQEVGRKRRVMSRLRSAGFGVYTGDGSRSAHAVAVVWHKDRLARKASGTVKVGRRTYVGPKGSGPSTLRDKYVNWVRFTHRASARTVTVGSTHVVPSVHLPVRRRLARLQVQRTAAWVERQRGAVFVAGDWNMTHDHPLFAPLVHAGMVNNHEALDPLPTFGRRAIDMVFERRGPAPARLTAHWTVRGASDHRASLVRYTVRPTHGS